jgi:hypothetical protein
MIRGLMRQAVHPMDDSLADSRAQATLTGTLDTQGDADGANQGGGDGAKSTDLNTSDLRPGKLPGMTVQATDSAPSPVGGGAAVKPVLLVAGNHRKVNGTTGGGEAGGVLDDELDEQPEGAAATTATDAPPPWTAGKTGRQLTFADEAGGALAEISYSNRTHYSKQLPPGAAVGPGRACCVIQ